MDGVNSFECQCVLGYEGDVCEESKTTVLYTFHTNLKFSMV